MFPRFPKDDPFGDTPVIDDGLDDPGFNDPYDPIGGGGGGTISDTTRPTLIITDISPQNFTVPYNQSASSTITVDATDIGTGIATVEIDGVRMLHTGGNTYIGLKTYSYNSSYASSTRTNYFNITATDLAGNVTTSSDYLNVSYAAVPDNTAPSVEFTAASPTTIYLNNSTTSANVSLTVAASDTGGSGLSSVSVNNGASQVYQIYGNWYFQKTFNFNDYGWGNTTVTFTATATDGAGNSSTDTQSITVNKSDTQAPSISTFSASASSLNISSNSQSITYTLTATDNRSVNSKSVNGSANAVYGSGNTTYYSETFSPSSYGFGTHTISRTATVSDAAGNTSTASLSFTLVKNDVSKPTISKYTVSNSNPTVTTSNQTVNISYMVSATDNVGVTSYSISGATFSHRSGNDYHFTEAIKYANYNFGNTAVTRRATFGDAAGNTVTSDINVTVSKVDNQSPTISSFTANDTSVTLTSSSKTQTVTYTAVVSDNRGVASVSVSGLTFSSSSGNNYYFTKTYNYDDYSYGSTTATHVCVATDAAGNTSTLNESVTVSKTDNQAPSISSFTVSDSSITVTSSNTSQTVTFAVTATDNRSVSSWAVSGATYSHASGNTRYFTKTYSFNSYNYGTTNISETATVSDAAGNSATASKSMTVSKSDNSSPSISSFTADDTSVSLTTGSQSQIVTFTVVATDNKGISSVSVNNGASGGLTSGNNYYFTKTFSYADYNFGNTTTTFTATATDAAGNSTSSTLNVTISKSDTQSPIIQEFNVSSNVALTSSSTSQTVTYTVEASDNRSVTSFSVNGGAGSASGSGSTRTFSETFNYSSYTFGTHTISRTATVSDAAGNSDSDTITFTLTKRDNQAPVISSFTAADTTLAVNTQSQTATATYTATITDNVAIDYVRFEGNPPTGTSGSTYTYVKTFSYSSLNFGSNTSTIACYAQDTAGNSATLNESVTITKTDTSAPTISNLSVSTDPALTTDDQTETILITADITDNVGINTYSIAGADFVSRSGNTYTWRKVYEYDDYSFGTSTDTITLSASDSGGNSTSGTVSASVSKTDTQAPTITSFGANNSTVTVKTSSKNATVRFTAVVTDNVGIDTISVTGATAAGSSGNSYYFDRTYNYDSLPNHPMNYGNHTSVVTLTVTDAAGNTSTDATTVTVIKQDDQNPRIDSYTVSPSTTVTLSTSSQTATLTYTVNVSDNVAIATDGVSMNNGATLDSKNITSQGLGDYIFKKTFNYSDFSIGSTQQVFTVTVKDWTGNTTTQNKTITVNVSDDQAPSISSITRKNGNTAVTGVTLLASSENTETITFTATATDNIGISNVTMNGGTTSTGSSGNTYTFTKNFAFANYSFGTQTDTFTATATDAAGNSSTLNTSIVITKRDDVRPTISNFTQSHTSLTLLASTSNTVTVTFRADITDNVGVNSVSFGGLTPSISGNSYTWTKNYAFADYSYGTSSDTLTLSVSDSAGNTRTGSKTVSIVKKDDVAPTISSFSANSTTLTWLTSENDTSDKTVTFTVVASDNKNISSIGVTSATQTNVSGNTYTFTRAFSPPSLNGMAQDVVVLSVADDDNTSTSSIVINRYYTDNTNPTISSFSANDTSVSVSTSSQSQTVTFTAVVTDNDSISSVKFNNSNPTSTSGNTYTFQKTYAYGSYSFGNSTDTVTVTATDNAGNTSTSTETVTITKTDDQAPTITSFGANVSSVNLTTSSQTANVTFTVVATDNVGISGLSVSGATLVSNSGNTWGFTKTYNYSDFNFGSSSDTVTATATDSAGNSSTDTVTISVSKGDNQNPNISDFSVSANTVNLLTSSQSQTLTFEVTATDNVAVSSVSIPGATYVSKSTNTRTFTKEYKYANYNFGTTNETITATVTDTTGNTATENVFVSVVKSDNQDPAISSFSVDDNTISLTTDSQSATATFTAVATDNRSVTSYSLAGADSASKSGNTYTFTKDYDYADFNFGSSTRTETVTIGDAAGNTTTDTVNVTITKSDTQDPVISSFSPSATSITLKTSDQSKTVTFTLVASDNRGVSSASVAGATQTNVSGSTYTFTKDYAYGDYSFGSQTDTLTATVTDAAGNSVTSTTTVTVVKIDDQNPVISSYSASSSSASLSTSSQTKNITFTAVVSDNRAVTSVTIDGQSATNTTGNTYAYTKTYDYDDYSFGSSTDNVGITISDAAGNTATDSVTISITKGDDQAPTITSYSANTTTVALKTSAKTQTVTFTAVVSDNVGINSISVAGATQTNVSGSTYTFTKTYNYADYTYGSHTHTPTLTVSDAAGNTSTNNTITVNISKSDDQNPSITSFSADDTSVDLKTSAKTQTVLFTAVVSDNVGINSISVSGATQSSVSGGTYVFSKTYSYSSYSYGSSTDVVALTVSDSAGNSSTSSVTVNITKSDDQVPTISNFTTSDNSFSLTTSANTKTVTYSVTATDNRGISSIAVSGATLTSTSGNVRAFSRTFDYDDYSFGSNTTTVSLTVTDAAGNVSTDSITHTITKVDNQNPTVSNITADDTSVALKTSSQSQTVTFSVTATDNVGVNSVTWEGSQDSSSSSGNTYYFQKTYSYGDYTVGSTNTDTVSVVVNDAAGNSVTKSINVTITTEDDQDPSVTALTSNQASNIIILKTSAQSKTVTYSVTATDNVGVSSLSIAGASLASTSGNTKTFTKTYSYGDYTFGDSTDSIVGSASDAAGNSSSSTLNMTVRKQDDQSPAISSLSADDTTVALTTSSQSQTVTFTVVATDNRAVSSVSIPGTSAGSVSGNNYTFTKTYSYADYTFGSSSDTLTATATDAAGNSTTDTITINISKTDNQNPTISSFSASATTVALKTSEQSKSVVFTVVATDNVGVDSVAITGATLSSTSGNTYTLSKTYSYANYNFGSNTDSVTLTVTDTAGNSTTDSMTITITKSDDQNPSISNLSPEDSTVTLKTSSQSQTVTFIATISDNVGIDSVSFGGLTPSISGDNYTWTKTYSYADYSFGSATDTLTLTVADAAGNSSTDSVTVNISKSDDQNPTVSNISATDTSIELSTSSQSQTVTFSITASDNVGVNSVTWEGSQDSSSISGSTYRFQKTYSYSDYSVGSVNTDNISVVVTDAAGNSTSKNIDVTITTEDDQDPVISSISSNKS